MCGGVETVETTMKPPPTGTRSHMLPALIIRGVTTGGGHRRGRWGGATLPLAAALDEAHDLAQPLECEQRCGVPWGRRRWCTRIIGRTHGERRVGSIREPHNEVRISTLSDPDKDDTLAAEGVMRMGNGHRFRRWLDKWGSVL